MGRAHLETLKKVAEVEVRAVIDSSPRAWNDLPYAHRATHPETALADPHIEAVAVCVPPADHSRTALEALAAGKHVFVEKPVALTEDEGEALRATSGLVYPGFHLRHHPQLQRACGHPVDFLRTAFTNNSGMQPQPDWRKAPEGGVLWNLGVHHFDLWRYLTGSEVIEVQATGREFETVCVHARMAHGLQVSGHFSHVTADHHEVELFSRRGRLRVTDYRFDNWEQQATGTPPGSLRTRAAALPALLHRLLHGSALQLAYRNQWRHFAAWVRGLEQPRVTLDDGLKASAIARAATEALRTGKTVAVR